MNFINHSTIKQEVQFGKILVLKNSGFTIETNFINSEIFMNLTSYIIDFSINQKFVCFDCICFYSNSNLVKIIKIPKINDLVGISYELSKTEKEILNIDSVKIGFLKSDINGQIIESGLNLSLIESENTVLKTIPINTEIQPFYGPEILIEFNFKPQDGSHIKFNFFEYELTLYPNSRYEIYEFDEDSGFAQYSTSGTLTQTVENIKNCILNFFLKNGLSFSVESLILNSKIVLHIKSNFVHPFSSLNFSYLLLDGSEEYLNYKIEKNGFDGSVVLLKKENSICKFESLLKKDYGYFETINDEFYKSESNKKSFICGILESNFGNNLSFGLNSIDLKTPEIRTDLEFNKIDKYRIFNKYFEQQSYINNVSTFNNSIKVSDNVHELSIVVLNKLTKEIFKFEKTIKDGINRLDIIFYLQFLENFYNSSNYPLNKKLFEILLFVKDWNSGLLKFDSNQYWWLSKIGNFDLKISYENQNLIIKGISFYENKFQYQSIFYMNMLLNKTLRLTKIQYPEISLLLKYGKYEIETNNENLTELIFREKLYFNLGTDILLEFQNNYQNKFWKSEFQINL